jgi:hypothetical protein
MTVNREETCSPLETDPILPVLHSHSAFEYQAMANIALDTFALPVFSTFCAVPPASRHCPAWRSIPKSGRGCGGPMSRSWNRRESPPPILPACSIFYIPCVLNQSNRPTMHRTTTNARNASGTCGASGARSFDHGLLRGCRIFSPTYGARRSGFVFC